MAWEQALAIKEQGHQHKSSLRVRVSQLPAGHFSLRLCSAGGKVDWWWWWWWWAESIVLARRLSTTAVSHLAPSFPGQHLCPSCQQSREGHPGLPQSADPSMGSQSHPLQRDSRHPAPPQQFANLGHGSDVLSGWKSLKLVENLAKQQNTDLQS